MLQEVAKRLTQCMRESDTVARVGGDEFVVMLQGISSPEEAALVVEKIRSVLNQPFTVDGHRLNIMPSIGIALYPEHGDDEPHLLKHADKAMYLEKSNDHPRSVNSKGSMNPSLAAIP